MSKKKDGIIIYQSTADAAGEHRFLGITVIDGTALNIFKITGDIDNNKNWMADCIHSELVRRISDSAFIAYYITDPPWPVSKRDSVIRVDMFYESDTRLSVKMAALPEGKAETYIKKNRDYTRIYSMTGNVELNESNGKTEVRFVVSGGPGGHVPDFVVKWGGWRIPYKTLSGLRSYVLTKNTHK